MLKSYEVTVTVRLAYLVESEATAEEMRDRDVDSIRIRFPWATVVRSDVEEMRG